MIYVDVFLWENRLGRLSWDNDKQYSHFVIDSSFLDKKLDFAPILLPINNIVPNQVYSYSENRDSRCFVGLPPFIADSLPDKYGKEIDTLYIQTLPENMYTSSSLVRQLISMDLPIDRYVHNSELLYKLLGK